MKILATGVLLLIMAAAAMAPAQAEGSRDYVVAANDGYGLQDCLAAGSQCGQVVADAWCEAHGHGHALTYGPQNAVDGRPTPVSETDETYVIKCGD